MYAPLFALIATVLALPPVSIAATRYRGPACPSQTTRTSSRPPRTQPSLAPSASPIPVFEATVLSTFKAVRVEHDVVTPLSWNSQSAMYACYVADRCDSDGFENKHYGETIAVSLRSSKVALRKTNAGTRRESLEIVQSSTHLHCGRPEPSSLSSFGILLAKSDALRRAALVEMDWQADLLRNESR